jgi:murein DD-endopeptidase MepM/ murein hydrolase activator NlpD
MAISPYRGRFRDQNQGAGRRLSLKKRYYIMFVSRDEDGTLNKVPVPLHYAYVFVAVAAIGMFTITGLAGSYSRMLIKTARFNQLRQDHNSLQKDYAHLEKAAHEKDIEVASLGSLASEVSAIYGLTASKLAVPMGRLTGSSAAETRKAAKEKSAGVAAAAAAIIDPSLASSDSDSSDNYYKSVDAFYALRTTAMSGSAPRVFPALATSSASIRTGFRLGLGAGMDSMDADAPSMWPIMGPITSGFGQREDPVTGNGEGEFHTGVDISSPNGTPIRATADGTVKSAALENGYGRQVVIDHGRGIETTYGHMSGFAVVAGQTVIKGQVIGYVGHSGRTTGYHLHYEVRIRNTPVNPHKYLRTTMADLGIAGGAGS